MTVHAGDLLGPYEIIEPIGSGGMGEVYRARDARLHRDVAIKVSAARFSERFEHEARAIAALNHPHICTLYDVGPDYLVMELVEGQTLTERLAAGRLPVNETLAIARQIAEAIETAHDHGIVHRDLKPGNVKIRPDGVVKVLDFGLARVLHGDDPNLTSDPTRNATVTAAGTILGTAAYMSPEQATGMPIDPRTDIWAFGCVLFEMVSGQRPFKGRSVTEILAEVLKAEPDWSALPTDTPASIGRVLRRCLRKDARSRLHDMADVRIELEDAQSASPDAGAPRAPGAPWRERLAWVAAVVAIGVAATVGALRSAPAALETRVDIVTPPESDQASLALSPDGRQIVVAGLMNGQPHLWLRSLESGSMQPLKKTEGGSLPFWSPDGRSIAFFANSELRRLDLETGAIQILAEVSTLPSGGTWNRDGTILYSPSLRPGIYQVRDEAGARPVRLVPDGVSPRFLPDGRHFLFQVIEAEDRGVYVGSLDGSVRRRLPVDGSLAQFAPQGQLVYVRSATLFARRFDPDRLEVIGGELLVAERVAMPTDNLSAAVSIADSGALAFRAVPAADSRPARLAWIDRSGTELEQLGELGGFSPTLSPDGRFVAVDRAVTGNDIWLLENGRLNPLTSISGGGGALGPVFSPDAREIVFSLGDGNVGNNVHLFKVSLDGRQAKPLLTTAANKMATDWARAPDGREYLLFRNNSTSNGVWALQTSDTGSMPYAVVDSEFDERDADFSPDLTWIAYESNRSGRPEIYVHPFPGPGREQRISATGGTQVRWSPSGTELFYIARDGYLTATPVRVSRDGKSIETGEPERLFLTRVGAGVPTVRAQQYVVGADGKRFLMSVIVEEALSPITLVLNWTPALR